MFKCIKFNFLYYIFIALFSTYSSSSFAACPGPEAVRGDLKKFTHLKVGDKIQGFQVVATTPEKKVGIGQNVAKFLRSKPEKAERTAVQYPRGPASAELCVYKNEESGSFLYIGKNVKMGFAADQVLETE